MQLQLIASRSIYAFDVMYVLLCMLQVFYDVAYEREILSLRVKCKKNERGCDWTGELRQYEVAFD